MRNLSKPGSATICIRTLLLCVIPLFLIQVSYGDEEQTVESILEHADYYSQETWEHGKALELLHEALEQHPDNDDILWRISRAYADSAEILQKIENAEEDTIESYYQTAREYAERAIEANPENSMAYTRLAVATGQIALYKGIWSAISLVKDTRDAVEKALELDESNNIAHFVYARSHHAVSQRPRLVRRPLGLGWANMDTALKHFDKAIELRPDFIMYRLDAARAFIEEDEYERAYELLAKIPDLENQTRFDDTYREEAQQLLAEIENE